MSEDLFLGIDIGSVAIKTAVLSKDGQILSENYIRIKGDPLSTLLDDLTAIASTYSGRTIISAGITGSGGKQAAETIGAVFINEILAQASFAGRFYPDARTLIELGGEDAKLINLIGDETAGVKIEDFSMNTACAAGTGSFLDQQASRLHLTIEEFGQIALQSKTPPRVAGRCSVFAKSDMIHLQQIATPNYDIVEIGRAHV